MFFCHLDVSLSTKIKQIRSGKICSWIPVEGYQGNKRFLFPESFVRVGGGGGGGGMGGVESVEHVERLCISSRLRVGERFGLI